MRAERVQGESKGKQKESPKEKARESPEIRNSHMTDRQTDRQTDRKTLQYLQENTKRKNVTSGQQPVRQRGCSSSNP